MICIDILDLKKMYFGWKVNKKNIYDRLIMLKVNV